MKKIFIIFLSLFFLVSHVYAGTEPSTIKMLDGNGNVVGSLRGALDTHDSDVHWETIKHSIYAETANTTLIDTSAAKGATTINVIDGSGFLVGEYLIIKQGNTLLNDHFIVTAKPAANQITLDAPLDIALTATATVTEIVHNIGSVAGTLAAPVTYSGGPPSGEIWHITCVIVTMVDNAAMDYTTFGGIAAITNGLLIRVNKSSGTYTTLANFKSNRDFEDLMEVEYETKTGGGEFGMSAKWHLKNLTESIIRLDGTAGDRFEIWTQDDATAISYIHVLLQGHKEGI